jgi:hypothetical protein
LPVRNRICEAPAPPFSNSPKNKVPRRSLQADAACPSSNTVCRVSKARVKVKSRRYRPAAKKDSRPARKSAFFPSSAWEAREYARVRASKPTGKSEDTEDAASSTRRFTWAAKTARPFRVISNPSWAASASLRALINSSSARLASDARRLKASSRRRMPSSASLVLAEAL